MMKAVVLEEFGSAPALRSVERPVPAPGEVVVRVAASGVNPLDVKITAGAAAHARVKPPMVLGIDLAGVVTELGPDVRGFDVIFDTVGGSVLDDSFAAARTYTGHVVSILGWGTHSLAPLSFRGATYSGVFTLLPLLTGRGRAHHGEILRAVAALVDAGKITPVLDSEPYDLTTVAAAHQAVATGTARGKVVVRVSPEAALAGPWPS